MMRQRSDGRLAGLGAAMQSQRVRQSQSACAISKNTH